MGETRQNIRKAALALFNERGFEEVSMRDIARAAGIAVGTLTYHYERKDDLVVEMLRDLHAGFADRLDPDLEGEGLLCRVLDLFSDARANQTRYPFYFGHINSVVRECPSLYEENRLFVERLSGFYLASLVKLHEAGIVAEQPADRYYENLACVMVDLHSSWSVSCSPWSLGVGHAPDVACALGALLIGAICEEYRARYLELCSERQIRLL